MIDGSVFQLKRQPLNCSQHEGAHCVTAVWDVQSALPYFDGHFPGNPVLPGVAMIDAILEAIGGKLTALKSAKFMRPIYPGMMVDIRAHQVSPGDWTVELIEPGQEPSVRVLASFSMTAA